MLRCVSAALFSVFLTSCTSTSDPITQFGLTPLAVPNATADSQQPTTEDTEAEAAYAGLDETGPALPEVVAYVPTANPSAPPAMQPQLPDNTLDAQRAALATTFPEAPAAPQPLDDGAFAQRAPDLAEDAVVPAPTPAVREGQVAVAMAAPVEPPPQPAAPAVVQQKRRGFLSSFFSQSAPSAPPRIVEPRRKPLVQLASVGTQPTTPTAKIGRAANGEDPARRTASRASLTGDALPGVRANGLFEIRRRSGSDDDSDVDVNEDDGSFRVASAGGLARLAPNGLLIQHEGVDTACLKPSLVRVLKSIERHYGKKIVVTSGYRSPDRNKRARGARNSLHMYCAAADVQISGVSKWELAKYVRSMPGRGGVGTYCHTESVHVDVGPERDWNWRCRRRKK